jgi:hypothetical protein
MQNIRKFLPIGIILVAIFARTLPGARTIDDSFITFRYARNILAGDGFVYNPGEHVLGTTTPLYTGLMVLLGLFSGTESAPFPHIALVTNAIFDAITCFILLKLGEKFGSLWIGISTSLIWAILPFSVTFAIGGLETSLYVMLLTVTTYNHLNKRHVLVAIFGALSFLARPDALILIGPILLDRFLSILVDKIRSIENVIKFSIQEFLAFVTPVFLWIGFAYLYFGNPVPNSITAKTAAYQLAPNSAFIRLLQHFATPFMGNLTFGTPWIQIGIILYPFLFLIGARKAWQITHRTWPWLVYPWLYLVTYAIANPLIFRWYLTPPLPAYIFTILLGLDKFLSDILTSIKKKVEIFPTIEWIIKLSIVIIFPLTLSLRGWSIRPDHGLRRPSPKMAWYQLELIYHQAANYLLDEFGKSSSSSTIAAGDVGVLGYFTSARILDTVGLNSPEAISYYPLSPELYVNAYAVSPDLIHDKQPEYVVLLEVYGREGLFKDPRFLENYHLIHKIPTDIYDSDGMLIFKQTIKQ